jgi:hypothetical protein
VLRQQSRGGSEDSGDGDAATSFEYADFKWRKVSFTGAATNANLKKACDAVNYDTPCGQRTTEGKGDGKTCVPIPSIPVDLWYNVPSSASKLRLSTKMKNILDLTFAYGGYKRCTSTNTPPCYTKTTTSDSSYSSISDTSGGQTMCVKSLIASPRSGKYEVTPNVGERETLDLMSLDDSTYAFRTTGHADGRDRCVVMPSLSNHNFEEDFSNIISSNIIADDGLRTAGRMIAYGELGDAASNRPVETGSSTELAINNKIGARSTTIYKTDGTTSLRVALSDHFRCKSQNTRNQCSWRIKIDGKDCVSPGPLVMQYLHEKKSGSHNGDHALLPLSYLGYCDRLVGSSGPISVGHHRISVWFDTPATTHDMTLGFESSIQAVLDVDEVPGVRDGSSAVSDANGALWTSHSKQSTSTPKKMTIQKKKTSSTLRFAWYETFLCEDRSGISCSWEIKIGGKSCSQKIVHRIGQERDVDTGTPTVV